MSYFGKVSDYMAQPDPILVNSEEEALDDLNKKKVDQLKQLKKKVVDAYVLLNEIAQDVGWLNNSHLQRYRDANEWLNGQEVIGELPTDEDELVTANAMWKIEAQVKQYAVNKEAQITNYRDLRDLAHKTLESSDLEQLNTLLDAILRLPKVHIEIKEQDAPF